MANLNFHNERLAGQLQKEIGLVIAHEVRDPRIPSLVTVTHVKLAQDIRNATVYVSILGDRSEKEEAITGLNKAAAFIQRVVAGRITVKHFPKICFKLDNSIEQGQHINDLLKEIHDDLE
jgi:ribosome-binding factor A